MNKEYTENDGHIHEELYYDEQPRVPKENKFLPIFDAEKINWINFLSTFRQLLTKELSFACSKKTVFGQQRRYFYGKNKRSWRLPT